MGEGNTEQFTRQVKRSQLSVQNALMLIVTLGYVGLVFMLCIQWNDQLAGTVITGFVLFAQTTVRRFFDHLNEPDPKP